VVKMRKARNLLYACRRACGARWSLRPNVVHWLHVAIIRPSISYASLVWWHGCQTADVKIKLSRIQIYACLGMTGAIRSTPTGDMEAFTGLPPLDLVIEREAISAAQRLWILGCSSYLYPSREHSITLTRLQKSDTTFNMGVNVMRPIFNLEPKYRLTMLTREEWTRGPVTPPAVKEFVWLTDGSRTAEGTGGWSLWAICRKKAQLLSRKARYTLSR